MYTPVGWFGIFFVSFITYMINATDYMPWWVLLPSFIGMVSAGFALITGRGVKGHRRSNHGDR